MKQGHDWTLAIVGVGYIAAVLTGWAIAYLVDVPLALSLPVAVLAFFIGLITSAMAGGGGS